MPDEIPWRAKFIALANDLHRAQKKAATKIVDDPRAALHVQIQVEGVGFEFIHLPEAQDRFVLHCKFGVLPQANAADVLRKALLVNRSLARTHSSMFALQAETNALIYSVPDSLRGVDAPSLLAALSQIAKSALQWRKAKLVAA